MERTTITVSKDFRNELEDLRMNSETMEEMLKRIIRGSKEQIFQYSEPVAFVIEQLDSDAHKTTTIPISWSVLCSSDEGYTFDFEDKPFNCVSESAKIICSTDDYILVDFKTEEFINNQCNYVKHSFVCFNIFH